VSPSSAFDRLASSYDREWTGTATGRLQRDAFWEHAGPLFAAGQHVLDLGCGTGEDAVILGRRGVRVTAIDAAPRMVETAQARGVDARVLRIEQIAQLTETFDGAISNFGALNCVPDIAVAREALARLIRPGGYFALCMIGRFCLWELLWYAGRGELRKAARRWRGQASSSLGLTVFYPRVCDVQKALSPEFTHIQTVGIGVCVPPSYVGEMPPAPLAALAGADRRIAAKPGFRALADHRLLIFRRS
jgi:ubiquinone/menaquinone biosynthesis C-methylase UbiE